MAACEGARLLNYMRHACNQHVNNETTQVLNKRNEYFASQVKSSLYTTEKQTTKRTIANGSLSKCGTACLLYGTRPYSREICWKYVASAPLGATPPLTGGNSGFDLNLGAAADQSNHPHRIASAANYVQFSIISAAAHISFIASRNSLADGI